MMIWTHAKYLAMIMTRRIFWRTLWAKTKPKTSKMLMTSGQRWRSTKVREITTKINKTCSIQSNTIVWTQQFHESSSSQTISNIKKIMNAVSARSRLSWSAHEYHQRNEKSKMDCNINPHPEAIQIFLTGLESAENVGVMAFITVCTISVLTKLFLYNSLQHKIITP